MSYPVFDRATAPPYNQAFDFTGSPDGVQPVYVGWATPGSSMSAPVWMIRKFIYVSNGNGGYNIQNILYANNNAGFRFAWNTSGGNLQGSTFLNASVTFQA